MSIHPPSVHDKRAPSSSFRFLNLPEVYVLVPRSPYALAKSGTIGPYSPGGSHNPSTPLRAYNMSNAGPPFSSLKRKRSEGKLDEMERRPPETKVKRRKVSAKTQATQQESSNATPEFPNGFFYCHQCNKKRDSSVGLYCTYKIKTPTNSVARCKAKYCRSCLKNRYGHDLDEMKERGANAPSKETVGHDKAQGYIFKCPRCLGKCNCRACRKAMGLEPTGNLTLAAKKTGAGSVAVMLDGNVKMTGILPGKGRQVPEAPKRPKQPKPPNPAPGTTAPRPRGTAVRKAKPLPKVVWSPVPVPLSFTLDLALPRIAIREFILRFSKLLDMSRANLEELEEIGGRRPHEVDDDDSDLEQDIDVQMGWISETCLRAVLLGLLSLYLGQPELGEKQGKKAIQEAIQEIKASRANLGRMWGALAGLRAEFEKVDNRRIFPDPLPPPQYTKIRTTRSGALNYTGVTVTTTAQLVPVIPPLIEMVMDTQAVRDELEEGVKESKELIKEERERAKAIREQWEETKKNNPDKTARAEYKRSLNALEQARCAALHAYAPRFSPLGHDHEGRIYFALTPSMTEREAAQALLAGDTSKGGKAHGRAIVSADERSAMRRWGWFIAVWGKKPADGLIPAGEDDDSDVERWWGLWQPDEIRKLADWIAIRNGISEEGHPTNGDGVDLPAVPIPDSWPRTTARSSSSLKTSSRNSPSGATSSKLTPLSDGSDIEDKFASNSSLSSVPDDDSESESDNGKVQMRVVGGGRPTPTQNELKALVRALMEYAEVLDWRVWRMQEEPGQDGKENGTVKEKIKTIGGRIRAISPENFYGPGA